jgi:hypothetical protein
MKYEALKTILDEELIRRVAISPTVMYFVGPGDNAPPMKISFAKN